MMSFRSLKTLLKSYENSRKLFDPRLPYPRVSISSGAEFRVLYKVVFSCAPICFFVNFVLEQPQIEITGDIDFRNREGTNLRIPIRVKSDVQADVELERDTGRPLSPTQANRCIVEQYGDTFYVNLRNLDIKDTGRYRVKASNAAGCTYAPLELAVIAPPRPPREPLEVKDIKPAKSFYEGGVVELSWKPPILHEGEIKDTAVTGYVIERKDGKRKLHFGQPIKLNGFDNCLVQIEDLQPGIEYTFKVCSVNSCGVSEPLYSEPVTVKSPFGETCLICLLLTTLHVNLLLILYVLILKIFLIYVRVQFTSQTSRKIHSL